MLLVCERSANEISAALSAKIEGGLKPEDVEVTEDFEVTAGVKAAVTMVMVAMAAAGVRGVNAAGGAVNAMADVVVATAAAAGVV